MTLFRSDVAESDLRKEIEALRRDLDLRVRIEAMHSEMLKYRETNYPHYTLYGSRQILYMDEIALRLLAAILSKGDGLNHVNEQVLRKVFRAAYEFQQVSADAASSPEPEWLVARGGVNLK